MTRSGHAAIIPAVTVPPSDPAATKGNAHELQEGRESDALHLLLRRLLEKGRLLRCLTYHLAKRQLPGCCFNEKAERTYDRSFEHFAKLVAAGAV